MICQGDIHIPSVINFHSHHWAWRIRKYTKQRIINVPRVKMLKYLSVLVLFNAHWAPERGRPGMVPNKAVTCHTVLENGCDKPKPCFISTTICQPGFSSNLNSGHCLQMLCYIFFLELHHSHKANLATTDWLCLYLGYLHFDSWYLYSVYPEGDELKSQFTNWQAVYRFSSAQPTVLWRSVKCVY